MAHRKSASALMTLVLLLAIAFNFAAHAQQSSFNLQDYQNYLESNKELTGDQLLDKYATENYRDESPVIFSETSYADSIQYYYNLNEDEMALLEKHRFLVTDRVRYESYGQAFYMIFKRDLPVYVSSDAILHALHMSYSDILSSLEANIIRRELIELLKDMHDGQAALETKYGENAEMSAPLRDTDIYLTVALKLLDEPQSPHYPDNQPMIQEILTGIAEERTVKIALFDTTVYRDFDFSQFTPRGHYTQSHELETYFQAMMWLGRAQLYLTVPKSMSYNGLTRAQKTAIGQRQTAASLLLNELLFNNELMEQWRDIEEVIRFLVGESDNVTPVQLNELKNEAALENSSEIMDTTAYYRFVDVMKEKPYSGQRIMSEILMNDPMDPDGIQPASSYMLFGQRFVIDSYIFSQLTFDRLPAKRMLPKSGDVLFTMGNNKAAPLLKEDMEKYGGYTNRLDALRYLIDHYDSSFWFDTFFNGWLHSIRALNPPVDAAGLPEFMQTNAWADKTMTTQLASWAELRHDNLLYAKQSYTGGIVCSYPHSYVEPVPEFFRRLETLANEAQIGFANLSLIEGSYMEPIMRYFRGFESTMAQLKTIAQKEVDGTALTSGEKSFLKEMLFEVQSCGTQKDGWYIDLYYGGESDADKRDYIVADVHTSPTNETGTRVGWVFHVGTGPLDLAVLTAENAAGEDISYVGPVSSYYETVTTNFKRLTDEE